MKRALTMAVLAALGCAPLALAQVPGQLGMPAQNTTDTRNRSQSGPALLVGAEYNRLTELTGSAAILIPVGDQEPLANGEFVEARRGLELAASAGTGGGYQVAGGFSEIAREDQSPFFFAYDVRGIFGKLGSGGLSPHSTYVGVDASYTFMHIRGSLGVAYRLKGDSSHTRWMFAPSIGIVIPFGRGW
jgi:hypothetical protein